MLTDTHAHLFWDSYKTDFDQVIQKSITAGITTIVNVGTEVKTSQLATDLNTDQIKFYSTIGIHPHKAIDYFSNPNTQINADILNLENIYYQNPQKVVAIGECGLDFVIQSDPIHPNLTPEQIKHLQLRLFQAQIDLAKKLNLPLTIHCRDDRTKNPNNSECWLQCLQLIKNWKRNSSLLLRNPGNNPKIPPGFLVSFAGNVTYPQNEYLRQAVKLLPLEQIVLETDCPFLPPQSKRGQRNDPSSVKEIAQLIAQIKGISFEEVAKQTTQNANQLFALQPQTN